MTNWTSYAAGGTYDALAAHNAEYQRLLGVLEQEMEARGLPEEAFVADLGAGTGNLGLRLARRHPRKRFVLLDLDDGMLAQAEAKRQALGLANVRVLHGDLADPPFEPGRLDAALYMHTLYALPTDQGEPGLARRALRSIHRAMRPGALLLVADIGREIPVSALARRIFRELRAGLGLGRTLALFARHPQAIVQNRRIAANQRAGRYWTHALEELKAEIAQAGFRIEASRDDLYFGLDDLVIARKEA